MIHIKYLENKIENYLKKKKNKIEITFEHITVTSQTSYKKISQCHEE